MDQHEQVIIKFNIGGTRYEVSQSLLQSHHDSMLAKSATEQWHTNPDTEIFIDRNGSRFQYVLDYLRDDKVYLPISVTIESLMLDFKYYGIENIKENAITKKMDSSYFGMTAIAAKEVISKWKREENILKDYTTIMNEFCKNNVNMFSLELTGLHRAGCSFIDCNEKLKKSVGLYVKNETRQYVTKDGMPVHDVSLALVCRGGVK